MTINYYSLWCQNIPLSTPIQRFRHQIKSFPIYTQDVTPPFSLFKSILMHSNKSFGTYIIPSTIGTNYITRIGVYWQHIYRNRWWMSCSGWQKMVKKIWCLHRYCSSYAKINTLTQKKSNNIALIYIRKKLWAAEGVVGVVMIVQTDAEVDRPNKIRMVCVLVGGRWEEKKLAKSGFLL